MDLRVGLLVVLPIKPFFGLVSVGCVRVHPESERDAQICLRIRPRHSARSDLSQSLGIVVELYFQKSELSGVKNLNVERRVERKKDQALQNTALSLYSK